MLNKIEPRYCITCKAPLIQRAHESMPRFLKKRFDSAACGRVWLKANKKGWWSWNTFNNTNSIKKEGTDNE